MNNDKLHGVRCGEMIVLSSENYVDNYSEILMKNGYEIVYKSSQDKDLYKDVCPPSKLLSNLMRRV
jgi:hypothetical protein